MDLTTDQVLVSTILLYLAMVLQSTVGFGAGLFAIPLLIWTGFELPHAIMLLSSVVLFQCAHGAYSLRKHFRGGDVLFATLFRYIGICFGVYLLTLLANLDKELLKQFVGVVVLLVLGVQYFLRIQPQERVHPAWSVLAFLSSGVLAGMIGMGGPPVILWLLAVHWSNEQTRAFLFSIFILALPLILVLLSLSFGVEVLGMGLFGLILSPLMVHASSVGIKLGNRLSRERLRSYTRGLLVIIALASILSPLI